jgi:hypothetical protein
MPPRTHTPRPTRTLLRAFRLTRLAPIALVTAYELLLPQLGRHRLDPNATTAPPPPAPRRYAANA